MGGAFRKMFWGFLFVVLEIQIEFIDLLPEPLGYALIFIGVSQLVEEFSFGKKAKAWALFLIFFSIPTVFVSNIGINDALHSYDGWTIYHTVLALCKLILVFYIFQLMLVISEKITNRELYKWTKKFSKIYVVIMLVNYFLTPFGNNLNAELLLWLIVMSGFIGLVLEIMFLVLIHRYKKLSWTEG